MKYWLTFGGWMIFYFCFSQNNRVQFCLKINNEQLAAEKTYFLPEINDSICISNFKFYISDMVLYKNNKRIRVKTPKAYLIDIADTGSLYLPLPAKADFDSISFATGIDSATNRNGAMAGALDPTHGMYWTWQSGYIHLKIEGSSPICKTRKNNFTLHIGGYASPYNSYRTLHLPLKDEKTIYVHLNTLFAAISLSKINEVMSPGENAMFITDKFKAAISSR